MKIDDRPDPSPARAAFGENVSNGYVKLLPKFNFKGALQFCFNVEFVSCYVWDDNN